MQWVAGYDRHVAKPFEPGALAVLIRNLMTGEGVRHAPVSERPSGKPTVPGAEDDPSTVELLRSCLEMQGYAVVAAGTVEQALREARSRRIDLLLSDHLLEDGNGLGLLRSLRRLGRFPAVMMTGRTEVALQAQCREAGFDDFVVKPVGIDALLARIAALLGSACGPQANTNAGQTT